MGLESAPSEPRGYKNDYETFCSWTGTTFSTDSVSLSLVF